MTVRVAVYRHFDADGLLQYVGVSSRPWRRASQHAGMSSWGQDIARIEVTWFDTREAALAEERRLIAKAMPLHNRSLVLPEPDPKVSEADLLSEIVEWCRLYNWTVTQFGTAAINDPNFVRNIEAGRECRRQTIRRVRDFMSAPVSA